jgi:hypothetical protein
MNPKHHRHGGPDPDPGPQPIEPPDPGVRPDKPREPHDPDDIEEHSASEPPQRC